MKLPLKILIHTIFWLVFLLFSLLVSIGSKPSEWASLDNLTPHFIINCIWAATIFYLFYFYFIRFFEQRQFVKYLMLSILSSIIVTFMFMPVHKFFSSNFEIFNYKLFVPPMIGSFILAQCGCLVRGFENWFANIQLKSELENRNLKNELELLKSQINPHFLFNSLNNIDSLIHSLPDNASSSLITLSDMLRYMIYETKPDKVFLDKEIVYIKNYIRLQQLRFRDKDYIRTTFPGNCNGIQIAPMLLIPFIENAFKYSFNAGTLPVIEISLKCKNDWLLFICQNYFKKNQLQYERTGGIGLENTKRRLELLYPGKYQLAIFDEDPVFKVKLNILLV